MATFILTFLLISIVATESEFSRNMFSLPSTSRLPGIRTTSLQIDKMGRTFVSAGNQLYKLNGSLDLEETRNLTSDVVNISLNVDGMWLVVCLTDLSCEVYNTTNLSAGPVFRRENVIRSPENIALFAGNDSFYFGSITVGSSGIQQQIILSRHGFAGSQNRVQVERNYDIDQSGFERNMYGGFVRDSNAYYFAMDNNPVDRRNIRVMRVCHNSDLSALYELTLGCGGSIPSLDARITGVSIVENFAGISGPVVILSRNRLTSSQNYVCLYSLINIDTIMQSKYNSCSVATTPRDREQIELAWRNLAIFCYRFRVNLGTMTTLIILHTPFFFQPLNNCHFMTSSPSALDDIETNVLNEIFTINLHNNFITASTAVVVESFSFVFVAFINENNSSFIVGVSQT